MSIADRPAIHGVGRARGHHRDARGARARPRLARSPRRSATPAATQAEATHASEQFAAGDPAMGIHEVMIASEKASISLRYATTLKNKAVEAYRELMNTQV